MFRMTVVDVFSIRGRGTVATGQVEEGTLRIGDEVQVNGRAVRVDGIEASRKLRDGASAGDTVGVLLNALTKDDVKPGDVITGGGGGAPASFPDMGLT